jgi:hypothetical protein
MRRRQTVPASYVAQAFSINKQKIPPPRVWRELPVILCIANIYLAYGKQKNYKCYLKQ